MHRPVRSTRSRAGRGAALVALTVVATTMIACERTAPPAWVDPAPIATASPSPLAQPPVVPLDSALADTSRLAAFLLDQDLLRETGAGDLVSAYLDSLRGGAGGAIDSARRQSGEMGTPMSDLAHAGHLADSPVGATALGGGDRPRDALRCARTLRIVAARDGRVAVWWTRRDRGRVALVAAWQDRMPASDSAGVEWRGPLPIDTFDVGPRDTNDRERGAVGCLRAAPSVAVDSVNRYVHVGYSVAGPEGAGVFYAHQMVPRGPFEAPIAIVYGDRLGPVRVAADGDVVAVAYEDPNATARASIGVALSRTAGHSFEPRLAASTSSVDARDPHVVVRGRDVVIGWSELSSAGVPARFLVRRARIPALPAPASP